MAKEESASLLLLSSNSYFGGDAELAGNSKELFLNRRSFKRPSFVQVKMNRSSKNNECVSSHSLPEKVTFAKRLRDHWQDLQDNSHWKYEQLSPVHILEKSKLHRNSTDIDELARAEWFWSRRPRLLPAASCIVWLILVLGLPFWLLSFLVIGAPLLVIAAVVVDAEIVRSVRWRGQYESTIVRLIRTSKNDRDIFGVAGIN